MQFVFRCSSNVVLTGLDVDVDVVLVFSFFFTRTELCCVFSFALCWGIQVVCGACGVIFAFGWKDWVGCLISTHIIALAAFVIFWVVWGVVYL